MYRSQDAYSKLTEIFSNLSEKHTPMVTEIVRENKAPFITNGLNNLER